MVSRLTRRAAASVRNANAARDSLQEHGSQAAGGLLQLLQESLPPELQDPADGHGSSIHVQAPHTEAPLAMRSSLLRMETHGAHEHGANESSLLPARSVAAQGVPDQSAEGGNPPSETRQPSTAQHIGAMHVAVSTAPVPGPASALLPSWDSQQASPTAASASGFSREQEFALGQFGKALGAHDAHIKKMRDIEIRLLRETRRIRQARRPGMAQQLRGLQERTARQQVKDEQHEVRSLRLG